MKSYQKHFSFDFYLDTRNMDYFRSYSFAGCTVCAPIFFLEAEFCSPQTGQLCGLKEVVEIPALGSCWNVRGNPQGLFFQVRVARTISQIHFPATAVDVFSHSWRLWHRVTSYHRRNTIQPTPFQHPQHHVLWQINTNPHLTRRLFCKASSVLSLILKYFRKSS